MTAPVESTVYQRSHACAWVTSDDHVTALALRPDRESAPVVLSGSGADIWLALERPMTILALSEAVAHQNGLNPESIIENIEAFLAMLVDQGLVQT